MGTIMKAFVAILPFLALAAANQSSHQSVKHGNAPTVHTSIHRAHGDYAATVHSQPAATPDEVHQYGNEEKYSAATAAKAVHHAPVYHAAPSTTPLLTNQLPSTTLPLP